MKSQHKCSTEPINTMDIKKIGIIAGIFVVSFLVIVVALYLLYPTINPDAIAEIEAAKEQPEFSVESYNPNDFSPEAVTRLRRQVIDLQDSVRVLNNREARYLANIDSLSVQVAELLNRPIPDPVSRPNQNEQAEDAEKAKSDERIQEIAKTLLSLDEEELTPIANLMTDSELAELYSSATKGQREKLLRVLEPEKAAKILKKVMS